MCRVEFYETAAGEAPVRRFLDDLPDKAATKVLGSIGYLQQNGPNLRRPHAAHVRGKLWELRVSLGRLEYRVFYAFLPGQRIVLLHGMQKKTQELPEREVQTAEDRWKDFQKRQGRGEVRG